MWPSRCVRSTGSAARVTFTTPKKLVSICARKSSSADVLDRVDVGVAGVVDDDVEPAECRGRDGDGRTSGGRVGDVERDRTHAIAVLRDEIVEILRFARRRHEPMTCGEYGFCQFSTETA